MTDEITEEVAVPRGPSFIQGLLTRVVIPLALVGAAVVCAGGMIAMRPTTTREAPQAVQLRVQVAPLPIKTQPASIASSGTVVGAQEVRMTPEVAGRVVRVAPGLAAGSRIRQGELIAQLDTRNYDAAVAAQEQAVAQAELNLALERNRAEVAEREWTLLGDPDRQDASLAKRLPHVRAAEKGLAAAEAALRQAKANLGRTRLVAPFDALVVSEALDVGQVVQPGSNLATLVGTDAFWVQIALPLEKLDGMAFASEDGVGSPATITQRLGAGRSVTRTGQVKQLMGQLDPQTRTAQVLVEIADPFEADGLPLLPGAYVDVAIEGKALSDTWEIPRTALDEAEFVWVVDRESALRKRRVVIGWRADDHVVVTQGIQPGDRLVTSPIALPVDGQVVTVANGEAG
jgi:RND family efflux transporter MFP subunit